MLTTQEVAQWMLAAVRRDGSLAPGPAVWEIERRFGPEFTCINEREHPAIRQAVLSRFRALHAGTVYFDRGEKCWRLRR
jgi:hypothetical protein